MSESQSRCTRAKLCVKIVAVGQPLCPNWDKVCVPAVRNLLYHGDRRDRLYVLYQVFDIKVVISDTKVVTI